MLKRIALTTALLVFPLSAVAQLYNCTTTTMGRGGWIPPKINVQIDKAGTSAIVYDGYIKQVNGEPLKVDVEKKGNGRFEMKWKLRNVKIKNAGSGILSHTFTLDSSTGAFRMRGRLHGYDNNISGNGTCKRG